MMSRFPVLLDDKTAKGLVMLARAERRDPRQQAAVIIERYLEENLLLDEKLYTASQAKTQKCELAGVQSDGQPD